MIIVLHACHVQYVLHLLQRTLLSLCLLAVCKCCSSPNWSGVTFTWHYLQCVEIKTKQTFESGDLWIQILRVRFK